MAEKQITRTVRSDADMQHFIRYLSGFSTFPSMIQIKPGHEPRSVKQNRLQFQWFKDATSQGDHKPEEYRAYCKLHFGVPLLRIHDEEFRSVYDTVIRPLQYEQKLVLMQPPIDLPVTSRMTVRIMTEYLSQVQEYFLMLGFVLTDPALMGMENWREWR